MSLFDIKILAQHPNPLGLRYFRFGYLSEPGEVEFLTMSQLRGLLLESGKWASDRKTHLVAP